MRNIEMRHLRYFVAVAEAGSVVAGARAVGIVQPALSRQIRELEAAIGTPLLLRRPKGMELTAAGTSFLRDARQLLAELQASRERAVRSAAGQLGELRLGVLPNYLTLPVVAMLLHRFRAACPDVKVAVEPMLSAEQAAAIDSGQLDGGILAWRGEAAPHLASVVLLSDRFVVAMPAGAAMQGRRSKAPARLADLAEQPCIWFDPHRSAAHHRFLTAQCQRAGFTPRIAQTGTDIPTLIGLVAAGMGYAFVPQSLRAVCPPTVRLVALDELAESFDVEFAFREDAVNPVVSRFVAVLREHAAARSGQV